MPISFNSSRKFLVNGSCPASGSFVLHQRMIDDGDALHRTPKKRIAGVCPNTRSRAGRRQRPCSTDIQAATGTAILVWHRPSDALKLAFWGPGRGQKVLSWASPTPANGAGAGPAQIEDNFADLTPPLTATLAKSYGQPVPLLL